jgi:hypothetical protein
MNTLLVKATEKRFVIVVNKRNIFGANKNKSVHKISKQTYCISKLLIGWKKDKVLNEFSTIV